MTKADVSNLPVEKRAAIEARRAYQREWRARTAIRSEPQRSATGQKSDVGEYREHRKQGIKKHRLTCTTTSDGKEQPTNHY